MKLKMLLIIKLHLELCNSRISKLYNIEDGTLDLKMLTHLLGGHRVCPEFY